MSPMPARNSCNTPCSPLVILLILCLLPAMFVICPVTVFFFAWLLRNIVRFIFRFFQQRGA